MTGNATGMARVAGVRHALASLVMAIVFTAGCAAAVAPAASPTDTRLAAATAAPTFSDIVLPAASPAMSDDPSTAPTDAPPAAATPTATVTAAPKPSPTLNWASNGCTGSTKDPVAIGSKARVFAGCPVGPTCTLKLKYPSGATASIPSPTHPKPGQWLWSWTIPTSAHAGNATGTLTCTYAGDAHPGPVSFKITDPALPNGYVINAINPAPRSYTDTSDLRMFINVTGIVPSSGSYGVRIQCTIEIWTEGRVSQVAWYSGDVAYVNGSGQFEQDFAAQQNPMTADWVGTDPFDLTCRNTYTLTDPEHTDTGTIVITP